MTTKQVKVVFTPSGRRGSFPVHTPLLKAARVLGVDIDSVCGGRGLCGRCQIICTEGEFAKHQISSSRDHLSALSETEKQYGERKTPLANGRRLSCHTRLLDDVVIDVPAESQVHPQVVRKQAEYQDIRLDPAVRLYYVQVDAPEIHIPKGALQRLTDALERDWQLSDLGIDVALLPTLQPALRDGECHVTVAVYKDHQIIALWRGFRDRAYGVAVDVGSTTVVAHLCNLSNGDVLASASQMNPQIRFGEDLMSRVSYIMMHPQGAEEMTAVIREAINNLFQQAVEQIDASVEDILDVTLVANPIMHHIFLGVSPLELGGAPFALATDTAVEVPAKQLGLRIHDTGRAYVLPCIAGHVGADTAAVILAEQPQQQDQMTLLVDVGTNAEIVLGNRDRLLTCSSPTGPAFEGAQISCGQRAASGAIERVRIDPYSLEPRFKVIGCDLWSDQQGFAEQTASCAITGICGSAIIEVVAEMYLAGIVSAEGMINGGLASRSSRLIQTGRTWSYLLYSHAGGGHPIVISQHDIRQIQLAKAALYAGVKLLMEHMGVESVQRIRLAGAFGSQISVRHAMVLGLIPDCDLQQVSSAGNAAGTGARIALLDVQSRKTIQDLVKNIDKIETAMASKFQEHFVDAMAFPHKTDQFPKLFSVVTRPAEVTTATAGGTRRRGSR